MSHETPNPNSDSALQEPVKTPGQILRQAREQQKMDIPYVAVELRLTQNYVRAIEDDRYENLPATPFVIGYLKSYAKLLSLSPDRVVEAFRALSSAEDDFSGPVELKKSHFTFGPNDLRRFLEQYKKLLIMALMVILIGIFGYWIFGNSASDAVPTPAPAPAPAPEGADNHLPEDPTSNLLKSQSDQISPVEVAIEDSQPLDDGKPSVPSVSGASDPDLSDEDAGAEGEGELISETPEAGSINSPETVASDILSIHFTQECWLEVVDDSGKTLAKNLYKRGDRIALQGQAPFRVLFGNASVVNAQINGEEFAIVPEAGRKSLRTIIGTP